MDNGRTLLAAALTTALPDMDVVSNAVAIDSVRRGGAAVVWTNKRVRTDYANLSYLKDEVILWVVSGADAKTVEDDLDAKLQSVLEVLEQIPSLGWEEAERGTLLERFEGWRITVNFSYEIAK